MRYIKPLFVANLFFATLLSGDIQWNVLPYDVTARLKAATPFADTEKKQMLQRIEATLEQLMADGKKDVAQQLLKRLMMHQSLFKGNIDAFKFDIQAIAMRRDAAPWTEDQLHEFARKTHIPRIFASCLVKLDRAIGMPMERNNTMRLMREHDDALRVEDSCIKNIWQALPDDIKSLCLYTYLQRYLCDRNLFIQSRDCNTFLRIKNLLWWLVRYDRFMAFDIAKLFVMQGELIKWDIKNICTLYKSIGVELSSEQIIRLREYQLQCLRNFFSLCDAVKKKDESACAHILAVGDVNPYFHHVNSVVLFADETLLKAFILSGGTVQEREKLYTLLQDKFVLYEVDIRTILLYDRCDVLSRLIEDAMIDLDNTIIVRPKYHLPKHYPLIYAAAYYLAKDCFKVLLQQSRKKNRPVPRDIVACLPSDKDFKENSDWAASDIILELQIIYRLNGGIENRDGMLEMLGEYWSHS